jgi:hypothetical protein
MAYSSRAACTLIAALLLIGADALVLGARQRGGDQKPSLSLRATPPVGFSPLRVRLAVDVNGGSDDYADFYCASVEWDWGDGTSSESSSDCDPYEAGKSTIRRRFTTEHVYRNQGNYRIFFRLKQKNKIVGAVSANVQVRAGSGEGFR